MRKHPAVLVPLALFVAAPAAAGWSYYLSDDLRPDRHQSHPEGHAQRLVLTDAEPGPACVCAHYRAARQGGKRGVVAVEVTITRKGPGDEIRRVERIELEPFRVRDSGALGQTGRACAVAEEVEPGDVVGVRWRFSKMAPLRTGFLSKISLDASVRTAEFGCV